MFFHYAYGNPSLCQGYKNYMIKVLLFFVPATCYASTTTILELAEDHRKKYLKMKFTIVPAYNKPDYLQNLDSIKDI
jgi:ferrochelatase